MPCSLWYIIACHLLHIVVTCSQGPKCNWQWLSFLFLLFRVRVKALHACGEGDGVAQRQPQSRSATLTDLKRKLKKKKRKKRCMKGRLNFSKLGYHIGDSTCCLRDVSWSLKYTFQSQTWPYRAKVFQLLCIYYPTVKKSQGNLWILTNSGITMNLVQAINKFIAKTFHL